MNLCIVNEGFKQQLMDVNSINSFWNNTQSGKYLILQQLHLLEQKQENTCQDICNKPLRCTYICCQFYKLCLNNVHKILRLNITTADIVYNLPCQLCGQFLPRSSLVLSINSWQYETGQSLAFYLGLAMQDYAGTSTRQNEDEYVYALNSCIMNTELAEGQGMQY